MNEPKNYKPVEIKISKSSKNLKFLKKSQFEFSNQVYFSKKSTLITLNITKYFDQAKSRNQPVEDLIEEKETSQLILEFFARNKYFLYIIIFLVMLGLNFLWGKTFNNKLKKKEKNRELRKEEENFKKNKASDIAQKVSELTSKLGNLDVFAEKVKKDLNIDNLLKKDGRLGDLEKQIEQMRKSVGGIDKSLRGKTGGVRYNKAGERVESRLRKD